MKITIERPGRTIMQLIAELAEESHYFQLNPAHTRPRCSNDKCRGLIFPGRTRETEDGAWCDADGLCGYCRAAAFDKEKFAEEQRKAAQRDLAYLTHLERD